jgi:hypothetical protein
MNLKAYFNKGAGVPLQNYLQAEAEIIDSHRPPGAAPMGITVLSDGNYNAGIAEDDLSDKGIVERAKGATYAETLQNDAVRTAEEISRQDIAIMDLNENIKDIRIKQDELRSATPDYQSHKDESARSFRWFTFFSLGEIIALFLFFSDWLGDADPTKIGTEIQRHPWALLFPTILTVSYFGMILWIAENALAAQTPVKRAFWYGCLIANALITGIMRAIQLVSDQGVNISSILFSIMFTSMGIGLPLAAAKFARERRTAIELVKQTDSAMRRLTEQEDVYNHRVQEALKARERMMKKRNAIRDEYRKDYQKVNAHLKKMERSLAGARLAFSNEFSISAPVKKFAKIVGLFIIAATILLIGSISHADEAKYNLKVLCDVSNSDVGRSCTPDTINKAGRYWIKMADDRDGGKFELYLINKSFGTTELIFSELFPESFKGPVSIHKRQWREAFLQRLTQITHSLPAGKGSNIAEAIFRSSIGPPEKGATTVLIFSDMLQVGGKYNFQKSIPSQQDFMRWLDKNSIRPSFKNGTKVIVSGLLVKNMTPESYERLLKLWQAVFKHWGLKASFYEVYAFEEEG